MTLTLVEYYSLIHLSLAEKYSPFLLRDLTCTPLSPCILPEVMACCI